LVDQQSIRKNVELEKTEYTDDLRHQAYCVRSEHLLDNTFIIESDSSLKILLSPWIVGANLARRAQIASTDFLRIAFEICPELRKATLEQIAEIVPLAGALYYRMTQAFQTLFSETLNRCFVGAQRIKTTEGWITDLSYQNYEAMPSDAIVLIGDTIATGGTMERMIHTTLQQSSNIRAILIYSIAGGVAGAARISRYCENIGIPVYQFYSNAIFGVAPNGTDMLWLHPGTIALPDSRMQAVETYGEYLSEHWCTVWDWGERAKQPVKHLNRILAACKAEQQRDLPDTTLTRIEHIAQETNQVLNHWKTTLSEIRSPDHW